MSIYGKVNQSYNPNRKPRPGKLVDYSSGKAIKTALAYRGQLTTPGAVKSFVLAGKGVFTLESTRTEARFTYRVKRAEDNDKMLFVSVLGGPDNTSDYFYLGYIRNGRFTKGKKSKFEDDAPSVVALRYAMQAMEAPSLPAALRVWHEGRCAACARKLTVPASLASGFGPECAEKHGIVWATPVCEAA